MRGFVSEAIAEPRTSRPCGPVHPAIFETRSGEGIVFLDLYDDEYSCRYEPEKQIDDYRQLVVTTANSPPPPLPETAWVRSGKPDHRPLAPRDVIRFGRALIKASVRFRRRTLLDLANAVQTLRREPRGHSLTPREAANLFQQMMLWMPLKPQCLFASFFLLHFLDLYGLRAEWIFGVQLFPFRAHCWLADDGELLNDVPHALEDYQVLWTVAPPGR